MAKKKAASRRGKAKTRRVKATRTRRRPRPAARRSAKKSAAKRTRKAARPASRNRKAAPRPKRRSAAAKSTKSGRMPQVRQAAPKVRQAAPKPPRLERVRRRLPDVERAGEERRDPRMLKAAKSGHDELIAKLARHTETSPKLTAGDIDAKWEDAYAIGDEAPGGDNPTPDQDRVDDIGDALGVMYDDNEELQGGDEILERDEKRWELDPASSDDWPHDKKKDE